MATQPNITGEVSASLSNGVRLPTAASRQVKNNRFAAQCNGHVRLEPETANRFGYKHPNTRRPEAEARAFTNTTMTPALLIVAAIAAAGQPRSPLLASDALSPND